jgi:UDP-GlcNAc:undecaprenyl-phosphate GlcNAc-1-phosphate transferase
VQSTVLTILVVVATINAVNFIDGLDGLAAGIVCIAAISFFAYYYSLTKVIHISALASPALASAVLIGMCLGFLPHNFSPASIFMGDTGAMLLGLLLAYAPISSINSLPPPVLASQINRYPEIMPLLLPAALLVIPYADLLLAVVRRTRAGMSPFAPDRKHLHHRLLDIGHSQRASVLIMYLWATMFSGVVVLLSIEKTEHAGASNHHGVPVVVLVAVTAAAVAVLLLRSMPRLRGWQGSSRSQHAGRGQARPAAVAPAPVAAATGAGVVVPVPEAGPAAALMPAPVVARAADPVPDDAMPGYAVPDRVPSAAADVTLPDISRSWQARPGRAGADPAPAGQPRAGGHAARSVVGTVPPAVTDPGPGIGRAETIRRRPAVAHPDAWPEAEASSRWQQAEQRPAATGSPSRSGGQLADPLPADEPAVPGPEGG